MKNYGNTKRFGNQGVQTDGRSFGSKLEAAVYEYLKAREQAGEIKILQCQDHVYLTEARVLYIPDFKCFDVSKGAEFFAEAKGFANDRWPTIKKLWKHYGPGPLEIYKGSYKNPILDEIIIPKGAK